MSAVVIDFQTRAILDTGKSAEPIEEQRAALDIEETSQAVAHYLKTLEKDGYEARRALFVVPDGTGRHGAAVIGLDGFMGYPEMEAILAEAFKKIHKKAKSEKPDEPA